MSGWEYKVVPAPTKGVKGQGIKGPEARFANALEGVMNDMGTEGWEYQRAETLPSVERSGLTGSTTEWRNVLVFRRAVTAPIDDFKPELLPPPAAPEMEAGATGETVPKAEMDAAEESALNEPETTQDDAKDAKAEARTDTKEMTASLKDLASRRSADKSDA